MNIVLVHGILGFSRILCVEYFRDVAEHLREKGHQVIAPALDPTQGIAYRGTQLRDQITAAFPKSLDPAKATHVIAHSMGGLDSRFMLSPANPARIGIPVRSLTTVGTPHRGSPIADLVNNPAALVPFPHLPFGGGAATVFQSALAKLGISLNGLRDLTTDYCRKVFNPAYPDAPGVAYFSVTGVGRSDFPAVAAPFFLFHEYISAQTGEKNDGLVSVSSAQWGVFDTNYWPADHAEEVGYNLDFPLVPPNYPCLAKYDQIVANLARLP